MPAIVAKAAALKNAAGGPDVRHHHPAITFAMTNATPRARSNIPKPVPHNSLVGQNAADKHNCGRSNQPSSCSVHVDINALGFE